MAHHFVTVCVVCVLCAAHTPCFAHTDFRIQDVGDNMQDLLSSKASLHPSEFVIGTKDIIKVQEARRSNMANIRSSREIDRLSTVKQFSPLEKNSLKAEVSPETNIPSREILERLGRLGFELPSKELPSRSRRKRNVGMDKHYFLKKVFETYGDGNTITMEGFEHLLRKLGLLRLLTNFNELEEHSVQSNQTGSPSGNSQNIGSGISLADSNSANQKQRCLSSKELLMEVSQDIPYLAATKNNTILPEWLFERVCPALVYQLAAESSSVRNGCVSVPENYKPAVAHGYAPEEISRNMFQVWVYSTISILIISLCGLLGVAVIPVMGKSYYHTLLQFLVALAIGTLCGDALIHLLPHAMMSSSSHTHNHEESHAEMVINSEADHNTNMWKGLVAMMGLVMFFFTEKALTMIAEWRKRKQRLNKLPPRVRVMREPDGPSNNTVGEKLCKHKYSSYPYCYGEITTETQDNHHNRQHNHHQQTPTIDEEKPLTSNCNSVSKIIENTIKKKSEDDWKLEEPMMNHSKRNADGADVPLNETESYTVIIREHETKHHGHTHSHGHVHSAPDSMSSVAWMVVMGDGLHNFTDGMAIGAAFSANIAGGFSTAIAVFCHELPHELGDFAVLLKAGMSAKQAVFYNLLSSILCLFGMVFGVLLGATPAATSWVFAAAAGMFIYIALVDMIPELSSSHSAEGGSQWQGILHALGLSTGLGIMLIIALYEHDLKHIFSE